MWRKAASVRTPSLSYILSVCEREFSLSVKEKKLRDERCPVVSCLPQAEAGSTSLPPPSHLLRSPLLFLPPLLPFPSLPSSPPPPLPSTSTRFLPPLLSPPPLPTSSPTALHTAASTPHHHPPSAPVSQKSPKSKVRETGRVSACLAE